MGNHVFVCYSRKDEDFALKLATNLKRKGVPVWLDQWDIPSGANWDRTIEKALNECSRLLLVLSPASLESDRVQNEWIWAIDKGKKVVLPVLYQECIIPIRLTSIQYTDFTSRSPDDKDALGQVLRALGLAESVPILKDRADDQFQSLSKAKGAYIMTASTGLQFAQEKESDKFGLFTKYIIDGIRDWKAANDDGNITIDSLYNYVHDQMTHEGFQEPMKWGLNIKGEFVLASIKGMNENRYAVLIGSSQFQDPKLHDLRCPENDVDGLNEILQSPCNFSEILSIKNQAHHETLPKIEKFLQKADKSDLFLFYYSGHAKQDRKGNLHLATTNTDTDALITTSIPLDTLKELIEVARTQKIVLILDCSYSGLAGEFFSR